MSVSEQRCLFFKQERDSLVYKQENNKNNLFSECRDYNDVVNHMSPQSITGAFYAFQIKENTNVSD